MATCCVYWIPGRWQHLVGTHRQALGSLQPVQCAGAVVLVCEGVAK
jgi:hypothetical protein